MLRYILTDIFHREHLFTSPVSVTVRMEEGVPADDLCAVFLYREVGELTDIAVYDDSRAVFIGVVDEEEHLISKSGMYLRISARSLAARLLDNEAAPRVYDHPSAALIYERHVKPYGIRVDRIEDTTCFGEQIVTKGMSEWTVLKNFCNTCYSTVPRISADGILNMKGASPQRTIVFSDSGEGTRYTSLNEQIKRCEEISRVNVKCTATDGYTYAVDNDDALERGIRRERYLNAALTQTPMKCADVMIRNSRAASYALTLDYPGRMTDALGCDAAVENKRLGTLGGLYISGLSYRMDQQGERTHLTLKRRDE